MTTKIDSNPTEQEIMQQVIYNLVLYLPISKLKLENNETTDHHRAYGGTSSSDEKSAKNREV